MREFDTGATRDTDEDKLDYEGYLSPLALERYASYLHAHRKQADGKMRDSDNWQKGLPIKECVKSMIRHVMDIWKLNRGYSVIDQRDGHFISMEEALCANIFNSFSILHELEIEKQISYPLPGPLPGESKYTHLSYPGSTCAPSTSPSQQPTLGSIPNTPLGPAHTLLEKEANVIPGRKSTYVHRTAPPTQYGGDE